MYPMDKEKGNGNRIGTSHTNHTTTRVNGFPLCTNRKETRVENQARGKARMFLAVELAQLARVCPVRARTVERTPFWLK